jgi:hypothetical protein
MLPADDPDSAADALTAEALGVLDSPAYEAASAPDATAVYNTLLARVIERIEVHKERVIIVPVVGKPHAVKRI